VGQSTCRHIISVLISAFKPADKIHLSVLTPFTPIVKQVLGGTSLIYVEAIATNVEFGSGCRHNITVSISPFRPADKIHSSVLTPSTPIVKQMLGDISLNLC
jgi:hypothetical protein